MSRHWAIALVLAAAAPLYLVFTHNNDVISSFSDSVVYLITARHYAAPFADHAAYAEIAAQSQYPPLYPLLLAAFGAGDDVARAHAVTTVTLIAAFFVLYLWLVRSGVSTSASAAAVLVCALIPGLYLHSLLVLSENLYLLFSLLALLGLTSSSASLRTFMLAALAASAATMTRSIGIALFVPLGLAALMHPRRFAALALVAAAAMPTVIWSVLHKPLVSYPQALAAVYGEHPIPALLAQMPAQALGIFRGLCEDVAGLGNDPFFAKAIVVLMLAAALLRALRLRADGIYVIAYFGILLIWPYPTELPRLGLMLIPVMLAQLVIESLAVLRSRAPNAARSVAVASLAAVLVLLLPVAVGNASRFMHAADTGLSAAGSNPLWYDRDNGRALHRVKVDAATVGGLQRIADFVDPKDCVYVLRPALVTFYSGRRGVVPPLDAPDDDAFTQRLLQMGCRYIVLRDSDSPSGTLRMFPSSRIRVPMNGIDAATLEVPGRTEPAVIMILAELP